MTAYEDTKFILKKHKIVPDKRLGQNFLVDDSALNKIAENVSEDDIVIEIGPRNSAI